MWIGLSTWNLPPYGMTNGGLGENKVPLGQFSRQALAQDSVLRILECAWNSNSKTEGGKKSSPRPLNET